MNALDLESFVLDRRESEPNANVVQVCGSGLFDPSYTRLGFQLNCE